MASKEKILDITRMLYPTGRAFRMSKDGFKEDMHSGLADSEAQAFDDTVSILDNMIPDNDNFSAADASNLERVLGLPTNSATPLADRKAAILQKMSFPGKNPARSNYLYLQKQLRDAGFNVYVFENIPVQNPATLNSNVISTLQYNNFQYGGRRYGNFINQQVANSIYNATDVGFNLGQNLKCTFFIGGSPLGTYANVAASREIEFRQMILRYKPVHTVAILFINIV